LISKKPEVFSKPADLVKRPKGSNPLESGQEKPEGETSGEKRVSEKKTYQERMPSLVGFLF
jgi:hypothetical protein